MEVLADRCESKSLNQPNDIIAAKDGRIYFTDPVSRPNLYPTRWHFAGRSRRRDPTAWLYRLTVNGSPRPTASVMSFGLRKALVYHDENFRLIAEGECCGRSLLMNSLSGNDGQPVQMVNDPIKFQHRENFHPLERHREQRE